MAKSKRARVSALVCWAIALGQTRESWGEDKTSLRFEVSAKAGLLDAPTSGRLLIAIAKPGGNEPRQTAGQTGIDATILLGRDVAGFGFGDDRVAFVDQKAEIFPLEHLSRLHPGVYDVQAILHLNRDLNWLNAPGDCFGPVVRVRLDPKKAETIKLTLDVKVPAETSPPDTTYVRFLKIPSKLLSEFHKRPIFLRAAVILPKGFDDQNGRKYSLRVHIGGYGSRFSDVPPVESEGSAFRNAWLADDAPRMVMLKLDGAGPWGDPYQVDSDNHGPYGAALTKELIPYVEKKFRCVGEPKARFLDGGSTGGWVSLALQTYYPDFFNGCWSFCPDGVDFRSFQLIDIYRDSNAYINRHGVERAAARDTSGEVRYTMRHEVGMENVLGRGGSWTRSGGQWGAWNATYGPRGPDGDPQALWDPITGAIDRSVVDHWKKYDLRLFMETHWKTLGPKLRGKIHIYVGEADDFFLDNAVRRLDAFLSHAEPAFEGTIRYGSRQGHCWIPLADKDLLKEMEARREGSR
ncbi:MAG: hypothetical protein NVSMB14_01150 [Isosphaeraceae bacterium]